MDYRFTQEANTTCQNCSIGYYEKPCRLERTKYCSEKCRIANLNKGRPVGFKLTEKHKEKLSAFATSRRGENAANWRGGTSRSYKDGYWSPEYKKWRTNVFERDNYTCRECGDNNYVTAHHIKSFAKYIDLRYDIDNGLTLCELCHSKTDNYKGKNRNKTL